jgi:hypothetical protein
MDAHFFSDDSQDRYKEVQIGSSIKQPTIISREGDFCGIKRIKDFIEIFTQRPKLS